jgi:hypothetical protein
MRSSTRPCTGSRCHTVAFWATLHDLAGIAEGKGLYTRAASAEAMAPVNATLTDLIKQSGEILKAIGRALIEAKTTCDKNGVRFEDYVMRDLKQTLPWATMCMKAAGYDLPAELGAENIKLAAAIKNNDDRATVTAALEGDLSPLQVKAAQAAAKTPEDLSERLRKELDRITHTIVRLTERQSEISQALEEVEPS